MIFGEELACFFQLLYMLECNLFLQSCFSAGCTRSLDSLRRIVVPDSFRYSFWTACTLGCAARSFFLGSIFLHNLPRENLCFKLFTQSYSFSDMTVVSSGTPVGDIPNVSSVMFLTDFLLPFLRGS